MTWAPRQRYDVERHGDLGTRQYEWRSVARARAAAERLMRTTMKKRSKTSATEMLEAENGAQLATINSAFAAIKKLAEMNIDLMNAYRIALKTHAGADGSAIDTTLSVMVDRHMPIAATGTAVEAALCEGLRLERGASLRPLVPNDFVRAARMSMKLTDDMVRDATKAARKSAVKPTASGHYILRKPGKAIKKMGAKAAAKPSRSRRGKPRAGQPRSDAPRAQR